MESKNTFKSSGMIFCFLLLSCFSGIAQHSSIDSLKGFLCIKFGDTVVPQNAQIRQNQSHGKFVIYHIDTATLCGISSDALTLSYYEGKLYQILLDIAGEKESMSLLNIFSRAFGPYDKLEMVSTEYDIRSYIWNGKKVEIKYSTDATYSGSKVIIYDKTIKDRMYNLPFKEELTKDEKKLLDRIVGK